MSALLALGMIPDSAQAQWQPEGVWSCLIYGDSARADERIVLLMTPAGSTYIASRRIERAVWRPVGDWGGRRRSVEFVDPRFGRNYTADLRYPTLGGAWETRTDTGGWWCAGLSVDLSEIGPIRGSANPEFFVPPLVPNTMASPNYPRAAIREAIEGLAVVCFLVSKSGEIQDPRIVQISDEIFELTTLRAINRSSYRSSERATGDRPGCREYTYTLDMIRQ